MTVGEAAHPQVLRSSGKSVKNTLFSASEQILDEKECGVRTPLFSCGQLIFILFNHNNSTCPHFRACAFICEAEALDSMCPYNCTIKYMA